LADRITFELHAMPVTNRALILGELIASVKGEIQCAA
jgi:hypothetical protein